MLAKSCIYVFIENQEHSNEVELLKALKKESSSYNQDPAWRPSFGHEVSLLGPVRVEIRSLKHPSTFPGG